MHSNEHEFSKPASPPVPYMNEPDNLHVQTRFDGTPNKTIFVTSYNNNVSNGVSLDNFPDESCDSYIDIEEASMSLPGKPMKDASEAYPQSFMAALSHDENMRNQQKREQYEPYSRPQNTLKPNNLSPHQELNDLIKSVDSIKKAMANEESPLTPTERTIDILTMDKPRIDILEEPETVIFFSFCYYSNGNIALIHIKNTKHIIVFNVH